MNKNNHLFEFCHHADHFVFAIALFVSNLPCRASVLVFECNTLEQYSS